jgi:hypothetical protein
MLFFNAFMDVNKGGGNLVIKESRLGFYDISLSKLREFTNKDNNIQELFRKKMETLIQKGLDKMGFMPQFTQ